MTHPQASRKQIYEELGVARNTFYKALKTAKERGLQIGTNCLQIGTSSTNLSPPHLASKLVVAEKETKTLNAKTPPTKEEVAKYAASQSAADLADEFYSTNSERGWMANGEPIKSWKAMFRGWFFQKPRSPPHLKSPLAFNEP